jgi:hypothetical protein
MLAIETLTRGRPRAHAAAVGALVAAALANYTHVYAVWYLERYYGSEPASTLLRHATWDKPEWVTTSFLWALAVLAAATFCASMLVAAAGARREGRRPSRPAVPPTETRSGSLDVPRE